MKLRLWVRHTLVSIEKLLTSKTWKKLCSAQPPQLKTTDEPKHRRTKPRFSEILQRLLQSHAAIKKIRHYTIILHIGTRPQLWRQKTSSVDEVLQTHNQQGKARLRSPGTHREDGLLPRLVSALPRIATPHHCNSNCSPTSRASSPFCSSLHFSSAGVYQAPPWTQLCRFRHFAKLTHGI